MSLKKINKIIRRFKQKEKRRPTSVAESDISPFIFESDFEDAGLPEWDTKSGYALTSTPTPISGNYCIKDIDFANFLYLEKDFGGTQKSLYVSFWVRWSNLEIPISPSRNLCNVIHYGAGTGENFWLFIDGPASDTVLALNTKTFGNTWGTTALQSDKWYHIKIYCEISATSITTVWIDDNLEITQSGDNTAYDYSLNGIILIGNGFGVDYDEQYLDKLEVTVVV